MTVWSVSDSGGLVTAPIYEAPEEGQSATRISAGSGGVTRVLWMSPGGSGSVWRLGFDNVFIGSFDLD